MKDKTKIIQIILTVIASISLLLNLAPWAKVNYSKSGITKDEYRSYMNKLSSTLGYSGFLFSSGSDDSVSKFATVMANTSEDGGYSPYEICQITSSGSIFLSTIIGASSNYGGYVNTDYEEIYTDLVLTMFVSYGLKILTIIAFIIVMVTLWTKKIRGMQVGFTIFRVLQLVFILVFIKNVNDYAYMTGFYYRITLWAFIAVLFSIPAFLLEKPLVKMLNNGVPLDRLPSAGNAQKFTPPVFNAQAKIPVQNPSASSQQSAPVSPLVNCATCGASVPGTLLFCPSCGTRIPKTKGCPFCGKTLPYISRFCGYCGKTLPQ